MAEADMYLTKARESATCEARGSNAQELLYRFAFDGDGFYSFAPSKLPDPSAAVSFKERVRRTILSRHFGSAHLAGANIGVSFLLTRFLAKFLMVPDWQRDGMLLDVGCRSGEWMLKLQSFGLGMREIEFTESAAKAGRSAGLDIMVGDLASAELTPGSFTTMAFSHVLKHVYSPQATLQAAHRALASGGRLLVSLPNFGRSARKLFGRRWSWLQMPTYLFHFDRTTLPQLVTGAGFNDVAVHYWFHGYSVDTARAGKLRLIPELLDKFYALAAAFTGDGKAPTLVACKAA